ncbi:MAG: hypothetical protein ACI8XO_002075 [Verrucomicrobiales bacterium]|jgi:hypothetical protein
MGLPSKIQFYTKLGFATGLMLMRTREMRRKLMFVVSIGAMLSVFIGGVLISDFLMEHPWMFLIYWFVSGTLLLGMIMLALYDMLRLRMDQAAHQRSELMGMLEEIKQTAAEDESAEGQADEESTRSK